LYKMLLVFKTEQSNSCMQ